MIFYKRIYLSSEMISEITDEILSLLPRVTAGERAIYREAFRLLLMIPSVDLKALSRRGRVVIASDAIQFPGFGKETRRYFVLIGGFMHYYERDVFVKYLN